MAGIVLAEIVSVLTIALVLVIQAATGAIESRLKRHKHAEDMLRMMYKELMILGMVAFALYIFETAIGLDLSEAKHEFEAVHVTLFVVAVFYAIFCFVLVRFSISMSKRVRDALLCPESIASRCCSGTTSSEKELLNLIYGKKSFAGRNEYLSVEIECIGCSLCNCGVSMSHW